jgi:hypothetical protein
MGGRRFGPTCSVITWFGEGAGTALRGAKLMSGTSGNASIVPRLVTGRAGLYVIEAVESVDLLKKDTQVQESTTHS